MAVFAGGTLSFVGPGGPVEIPAGPIRLDLTLEQRERYKDLNLSGALDYHFEATLALDEQGAEFVSNLRCPGCGVRFVDQPVGHTWSAQSGICYTVPRSVAEAYPPAIRKPRPPRPDPGLRLRWAMRTEDGPEWSNWHAQSGPCPGCCCGGVTACGWCGGREHQEPAEPLIPDEISHSRLCEDCHLDQGAGRPQIQAESAELGIAGLYVLCRALLASRGPKLAELAMNRNTTGWFAAHVNSLRPRENTAGGTPARRLSVPIRTDESLPFGKLLLAYSDGTREQATIAQVGEVAVAQVEHLGPDVSETEEGGER